MPGSGTVADFNAPDGPIVAYEIVSSTDGWNILQDSRTIGTLDTRMAAFDSVVQAAMTDMLSGHGVVIKVPNEPL
jgi:hypothetical protein